MSPIERPTGSPTGAEPGRYLVPALLVAGLVISFVLGFRGPLPTWGDEVFTLRLSKAGFGSVMEGLEEDVHPPLYFLLGNVAAHIWGTGRDAPPGVRALAYVLYFSLVGFTVLFLSPRVSSSRALVFPAILLATSAHLALFAPMMRYYALAAIGTTFSTLLLVPDSNAAPNRTFERAFWYGFWLLVSFYSSYMTVLVIPGHIIYLLMQPTSKRRLAFFISLGIVILLSTPLLPLIRHQMGEPVREFPGIEQFLIGSVARCAFAVYSFTLGEFIPPWRYVLSIPALAAFLILLSLALRQWRTPLGLLLWLTILTALPVGAIALAVLDIGLEFSASRLFFLAPIFLILLGLAPSPPAAGARTSRAGLVAIAAIVMVNIVSTWNYSKRTDFIQSTYIIPWTEIGRDIARSDLSGTVLLYDDDTLLYWAQSRNWEAGATEQMQRQAINVNTPAILQALTPWYSPDRIILVYSPRDITPMQLIPKLLEFLDSNYRLETEKTYLHESETGLRFKSMLFRRTVEPVKKVLRVYVRR
jgi:hypothetical protein